MSSKRRKQRRFATFLPTIPNGKPISDQKFEIDMLVDVSGGNVNFSPNEPQNLTPFDVQLVKITVYGKTQADAESRFRAQVRLGPGPYSVILSEI